MMVVRISQLCRISLLSLLSLLGCHAATKAAETQPFAEQALALVQRFYTQVLARNPNDLLGGADWPIFTPYFSQPLVAKLQQARACDADWDRHNPYPPLKARLAQRFIELDAWGDNYGRGQRTYQFKVDKATLDPDHAVRVIVTLTKTTKTDTSDWRVAPIVRMEQGKPVIDEIVFLDDNIWDNEADRRNLPLTDYLALGCDGPRWARASLPTDPTAFVADLYAHVIKRAPGGIPVGADWKIFAPYLSKGLVHQLSDTLACEDDFLKKYPSDPANPMKLPFPMAEAGMFSGGDEETSPSTAHVDKVEAKTDGTLYVYVTLTETPDKMLWHVVDVLVHEDGHLALDDVIFVHDDPASKDYTLRASLSAPCKGTEWVGYPDDHF